MCYETALTKKHKTVVDRFNANFADELDFEPFYHRSAFSLPKLQIIKMDDSKVIHAATWGFVPDWGMRDIPGFRKKYNTFNAKSETLLESGTFKKSARENRCLIIADGFFEPHKAQGISIPHFCYIPTDQYEDGRDLFAFAGIYSEVVDDPFPTCTIITTEADDFFKEIHNVKQRMPLVINEELQHEWLIDSLNDAQLKEFMQVCFTKKEFRAHPVSRNLYKRSIETNTPEILQPIEKDTLF